MDGNTDDAGWVDVVSNPVDHAVINDTGDLIRQADVNARWRAVYGGNREDKVAWALSPLTGDLSYAWSQTFGRAVLAR